jgi:hypothetical protein
MFHKLGWKILEKQGLNPSEWWSVHPSCPMIAITPESILGLPKRGFGWSLRVPKRFCHSKRCGTLSLCFKICTVKLRKNAELHRSWNRTNGAEKRRPQSQAVSRNVGTKVQALIIMLSIEIAGWWFGTCFSIYWE